MCGRTAFRRSSATPRHGWFVTTSRRGVDLRREAQRHARARGGGREDGGRSSASSPSPTTRCGRAATTLSPGSRTWIGPASSHRCASPPSPASAVRCSSRLRTRTWPLLCVQAYNDWMIEEWCGRAPAATSRSRSFPLGPAAGRRRGPPHCREGVAGRRVLREPGDARPADDPGQRWPLGSAHRGVRGDGDGGVHAHRLLQPALHHVGRITDARHDVMGTTGEHRRRHGRVDLQSGRTEVSRDQGRPRRGRNRLDARSSSTGAPRSWTSIVTGSPRATCGTTLCPVTSR